MTDQTNLSPTPAETNTVVDWKGAGNEIHISDIYAFKACRRQWNWTSRLRENLEPIRPYHPFFFGRMVHDCLEKWYWLKQDPNITMAEFLVHELAAMREHGAIWAEEQAGINEQIELARGLLDHYMLWENRQVGAFAVRNLEFIAVEQTFRVPLFVPGVRRRSRKVYFAGKWDGLVRRRDTGDLYIWELKTTRSLEARIKQLDNDPQCTAYLWAARQIFGDKVKGMVYTVMNKRVPAEPKVLSSTGMLSRDMRNQSFDSYRQAIRNVHGNPDKGWVSAQYGEVLLELYHQKPQFFDRVVVGRTPHALDLAGLQLYDVAREMARPNLPIYPSESQQCNYCLMREPCIAMQNGTGHEAILEAGYRRKEVDIVGDDGE